MPNTLADVLRAGVRERERTGVRPVLKVGMDHTSTAPVIGTALNELPGDILRRINDETIYCNGPLFHVQWVKNGERFMYTIRGFRTGTPSDTVMQIRDALDGYWAELFKEKTGRDIVWKQHHSPSQENPTGNRINWVSKNFESRDISFALCKEWAYLATNRMIHHLGYSLETSSERAPDTKEALRFQTLAIGFDICTHQSKRLDPVVRNLKTRTHSR